MTTFFEATQAKLILKMSLSNYSWYEGISVIFEKDKFLVLVSVSKINNMVKKIVPNKVDDVIVRLKKEKGRLNDNKESV